MTIELIPLEGLPEVEAGDDLAAMLEPSLSANAASDGDVVAVTQKVVSKAEGRIVAAEDREAWVARESVSLVARRGDLVIARTRHGFVCANAGVDISNVREGSLTLLPEDPDASAERLQKELCARLGLSHLGVVITDTFGRPWREGVVDVAIGCAGLPPLLDLRGTRDHHGKELEATVVAMADAVAAATGLVMTKTARVPAALVRGLDAVIGDAPPGPARALVRAPEDDLFRESMSVAVSAAQPSASFGIGTVPRERVEEAVIAAWPTPSDDWLFAAVDSAAARRRLLGSMMGSGSMGSMKRKGGAAWDAPSTLLVLCARARASRDDALLLSVGSTIRNLVLALHAQHVGWSWDPTLPLDPGRIRAALGLGDGWSPVAVVGVGPPAEAGAGGPLPRPNPSGVLDWRD